MRRSTEPQRPCPTHQKRPLAIQHGGEYHHDPPSSETGGPAHPEGPSAKGPRDSGKTDKVLKTGYSVLITEEKPPKAEALIAFGDKKVCILKGKAEGGIYTRENLILVELVHPTNIEDVPGVLLQILFPIAEAGISVVEVFSAWDRTYLLIDEKEVGRLLPLLLREESKGK